jgi:putative resolvase
MHQQEDEQMNKLWTPQEAADFWNVNIGSVYRWIRANRIVIVPVGREYRIPNEQVQKGIPRN